MTARIPIPPVAVMLPGELPAPTPEIGPRVAPYVQSVFASRAGGKSPIRIAILVDARPTSDRMAPITGQIYH